MTDNPTIIIVIKLKFDTFGVIFMFDKAVSRREVVDLFTCIHEIV
jgi:hypothetical protein